MLWSWGARRGIFLFEPQNIIKGEIVTYISTYHFLPDITSHDDDDIDDVFIKLPRAYQIGERDMSWRSDKELSTFSCIETSVSATPIAVKAY